MGCVSPPLVLERGEGLKNKVQFLIFFVGRKARSLGDLRVNKTTQKEKNQNQGIFLLKDDKS